MKLVIDRECSFFGACPEVVNKIKQFLTMENPVYAEARKHKRWTGKIDRKLVFYNTDLKGCIKFPRGAIRRVLEITGRRIDFQDHRRILPSVPLRFRGELRPYQDEAVQAILKKDFGVLEAATGSGKTVVALSVIAGRKQPTLILVHSKLLLCQWGDMIAKFLGTTVGQIGDGKFDIQPITVATINSACKHLDDLPRYFGQIVFDETHKIPAMMSSTIVQAFDCKYMLGLSATPYRRDQLTRLIHWFIGDFVHKIDPKELQKLGAVLIPEIIQKQTDFHYDFKDDYAKMLSVLTQDETRNAQIAQDILKEATTRTGTVLVVSDRIKHCLALADLLLGNGVSLNVKILTSQLKKQERLDLVEDIKSGVVDVVIATVQLVGEGVDISNLSSLFFATPIKFGGRVVQVVGRILRPADGKVPRLYDYQDPISVLYASARARQVTYRRMNWLK